MAAARITVDDRAREKARSFRHERDWSTAVVVWVPLPAAITERALLVAGYRPAPQGGCVGPDGEHYGSLEEAARVEFMAAAMVGAEASGDPIEEALRQIREVAMIPVGQVLLSPEDRLRALTAKLERIGNIAADGEPDEDWRPSLIDEAGS